MFPSLFVLVAWGFSFTAAANYRSIKNIIDECNFSVGNQTFDLCPVISGNEGGWIIESERRTPPTITKTVYQIGLKEKLEVDESKPKHEQCFDGTFICMTVINHRPLHKDEDPRVLQVVPIAGRLPRNLTQDEHGHGDYYPGLNFTVGMAPSRSDPRHDVLHLIVHGGYYDYRQQKADIQFICDHDAEEPTNPTPYYTWNGTTVFRWRTKQACTHDKPTKRPPSKEPPATGPPAPDEPPADDDEQDLVDPDAQSRYSRRKLMATFGTSACMIFVVLYLLYFPPRALRRRVSSFVKTHPALQRFRVGERVLVRWAYEDLGFEDGEEDVMVNAAGNAAELEEQIPLKPSPRMKNGVTHYGSA
ncbi:hypothetical protein OBBRIDRAFT_758909 [Obba rivulosa]|uniref:Autophagy-related protein 27 n=1 Tax=Obba rivulosa TaxID=1052685 RepID=A0A8E2AWN4_9APHY|nr:hypothetical protein OBBRIDRAFT_758909 [Obba rivulosa]